MFLFADAYLGGICNAGTPSGCLDENAECKDSICQCIVEFTDINGTCKAGKPIFDVDKMPFPFRNVICRFQSFLYVSDRLQKQ